MIEKAPIQIVWKFEMPEFVKLHGDAFVLKMPKEAQILTVQVQYGKPCIWAVVDPTAPVEERKFRIAGTGHNLQYDLMRYIGTFQLSEGKFIGHVFEV